MSHKVYLGLGSNVGDRPQLLQRALDALDGQLKIEAVSSVYETEPVGFLSQPAFLNLALSATTDLSPLALLRALKSIESALGRRPGGRRNGPRPIDIDILLYGERVVDITAIAGQPELRLPHPSLHQRAFVLVPLAEIAPEILHPVLGLSIRTLRDRQGRGGVKALDMALQWGKASPGGRQKP